MVQKTGPNLGLPYGWDLGESGWNTGMNAGLKRLDALVDPVVIDVANTPSVTTNGARYVVGTSPSGDFAGHARALAVRIEGVWEFYSPWNGASVFNLADNQTYRYLGGAWGVPSVGTPAQPFLEVSGPGDWVFSSVAWTKIPLGSVGTDTANAWDAGSNTDYIIPAAGMYSLQGVIRPSRSGDNALPDSTAIALGIGTTAADGDDVTWSLSPVGAATVFTLSAALQRRYAAGDRVSLFAKHASATSIALTRARLRVLRLTD